MIRRFLDLPSSVLELTDHDAVFSEAVADLVEVDRWGSPTDDQGLFILYRTPDRADLRMRSFVHPAPLGWAVADTDHD